MFCLCSKAPQLIAHRSIHIRLLNLRDGSPHSAPASNVITWELPSGEGLILGNDPAITRSRIAVYLVYWDEDDGIVCRMVVWNWKTGEQVRFRDLSAHTLLNSPQVLDLSSMDRSESITNGTQAIFLDEFCVAAIPSRSAITELTMFNTLVPQDHPGYMRRLAFPFHHKHADMHLDHDRDLGTPNDDEGLLPDPAQAVLVIDLWSDREPRVLIVVRTQVLVEQVYSMRADSPVPWDEWGRDAVVIEVQNDGDHTMFTFVHGAQVTIGRAFSPLALGAYDVRTFDFSQRGRYSLPFQGGPDAERRVLFEDGVNVKFEPDDGIGPWGGLKPLSDGSLVHLVSQSSHPLHRKGCSQ